ncbi:MAG: hypothetical protein WC058_15895 [Phycisphaeraceae bacterium]
MSPHRDRRQLRIRATFDVFLQQLAQRKTLTSRYKPHSGEPIAEQPIQIDKPSPRLSGHLIPVQRRLLQVGNPTPQGFRPALIDLAEPHRPPLVIPARHLHDEPARLRPR